MPGTGTGLSQLAKWLVIAGLGVCIDIIRDQIRYEPHIIVELGAGDYSNARAMKVRFPTAEVIATNLVDEWKSGKVFAEAGHVTKDTGWLVEMYKGWQNAQMEGLIVGASQPLENKDIPSGIADLVYSIFPYPGGLRYRIAAEFGADAGRIAKRQPGTIVAVTSGSSQVREAFELGYHLVRPSLAPAIFAEFLGAPFGLNAPADNRWGETGEIRTRMFIQTDILQ
jgi:hypothetical protein